MPEWELRRRRAAGDSRVDTGSDIADELDVTDLPVLRTMLRISQAVLRANYFDEALEVIAEQALGALAAASLSISRWERGDNTLRTLINVGDLGPGERRWPDDEVYPVKDDTHITQLLHQGRPYINSVDDDVDPRALASLHQVEKESEVAVPVTYDGLVWGEIWATGDGGRRFGRDDVQLLQAIAAHTAVAIGRAELVSTIWRYAHQDPLTGLANRRALDDRFGELDWETATPTLLVCDLDGFKEINDRHGHPAGDTLLRGVATVLTNTATPADDTTVARLGGDEFCILLPTGTLADAERFAHSASYTIRQTFGDEVTLTWGAADCSTDIRSGQELLADADAALRQAKTLGPGRFSGGLAAPHIVPGSQDRRRAGRKAHRGDSGPLLRRVIELIDAQRPLPTLAALEILAVQAQQSINAAGWAVSVTTDDGAAVRTYRDIHSVRDPVSGLWVLIADPSTDFYPLSDYPATADVIASGSAFIAAVGLEGSDAAETALLTRLGYRAVLAVGVGDGEHGYLVELYSADGHEDLAAIADLMRVLAHYCASAAYARPAMNSGPSVSQIVEEDHFDDRR